MLRISCNGGFLDLAKDSGLELERTSPFFIDNILAEFTMPVTIKHTDNNVRLLGNIFFEYTPKGKLSYPVDVYDGMTFRYTGLLTINATTYNAAVRQLGDVQGFIQNGLSVFVNEVKNKKLRELSFGGLRRFNFTTWDATDGSNGYVQHFQNTWDYTYDYVVVPCRNDNDELYDGWMNKVSADGKLEVYFFTRIFLFPKLSYVLDTMLKETGWLLDVSLLPSGWEKLILFSGYGHAMNMYSDAALYIDLNVANLFSPEVTVPDFLTAICRRYGWAPLFNSQSRVCKLVPFRNATSEAVKDFTAYASPLVSDDYSEDKPVYGWKNNFTGNDSSVNSPSFSGLQQEDPVASKADLPAPEEKYDYSVIYCYRENQWFKVEFDDTTSTRQWVWYADNIYDKSTEDDTYTYETTCTTLPVYLSEFRSSGSDTWYGNFPYCKQSRNDKWGIRTLLFIGMVKELTSTGTEGTISYPLASCLGLNNLGARVISWSNIFSHFNPDDNIDYGIVQYWFKAFVTAVGNGVTSTRKFALPLHELVKLQFSDTILVRNIPYLISKITEPVPYKGFVEAELRRITLGDEAPAPPTGNFYLRIEQENVTFHATYTVLGVTYTDVTTADNYICVYADAACTIPALPPFINVNVNKISNGIVLPTITKTLIEERTFMSQADYGYPAPPYPGPEMIEGTSSFGHFTISYIIAPGSGYVVAG